MLPQTGFKLRLAIFNNDPERDIFGAKLGGQDRFLFFNRRGNQLAGDLVKRQVTGFSCLTEFLYKTIKI